jgi:hypothetical protein
MNPYKSAAAWTTRCTHPAAMTLTNGGATTEPTWGTWRTRPNLTSLALEDSTWGEVTKDWERRERETVITRGRSPPPKLRSEPNLFQDGRTQGIPIRDPRASDDLAFKTGRRTEGKIQLNPSRSIPTHPNPFEPLISEPFAPHPNFVPETDTEDDDNTTLNNTQAQLKPPKRQKRHSTRVRFFKDEDITEEEKDLSMYSLSDEDSDSSLTIYYKAYDNNKPEMNESSAESRRRTIRK